MTFNNKNKGFSLTDVLLAMIIMGVVAALVTPTVLSSKSQLVFRKPFKKVYKQIDELTQQIVDENNGALEKSFENSNELMSIYLKKLNTIKVCRTNSLGNCWAKDQKPFKSNVAVNYNLDKPSLILLNSTSLKFNLTDAECKESSGKIKRCGYIVFDVNALKPPNKAGRDIFYAHILPNKLLPYGTTDNEKSYICDPESTSQNNGLGCAFKVLIGEKY